MDSRGRAALMARLAGQDVNVYGGIDPTTGMTVSADAAAVGPRTRTLSALKSSTQNVGGSFCSFLCLSFRFLSLPSYLPSYLGPGSGGLYRLYFPVTCVAC